MKHWYKSFTLFLLLIFFYSITLLAQPANNTCATGLLITQGTTCTNTAGTLFGADATAAGSLPAAVCGNTGSADVWYRFVALTQLPTVTLSAVGAAFAAAGPRIQILSAVCTNAATVFACSSTLSATPSTALTLGTTYYVRITTNTNTGVPAAGDWTFNICITSSANVTGSVMNEVFKQTTLVPQASGLNDPWEITYGPDSMLWITVAKDYIVQRMNPNTGTQTTVLNIAPGATGYLTAGEHTNYNRIAWTNPGGVPWPQGGLMGMAFHPDFAHPTTPKRFVYIAYIRSQGAVPTNNTGQYYTNFIVRFTYNTGTAKLESPVTICDSLPGSKDHNSGRLIIAPIGGVDYLFYSSGDMGSGQYENLTRAIRSQNIYSYEGKILRFNLEEDGDAVQNIGVRNANYNRWIPNSTGVHGNPYNTYLGVQSAVWNMGHRNVQGFAKARLGGTDYLYALSHGPYSDDELNVLEAGKNYGHPLVVGYSTDSNYNAAKAGPSNGSLPLIAAVRGELNNVDTINALPFGSGYKDPFYTFYPVPKGSTTTCSSPNQYYIQDIYRNCAGTGTNNFWRSEAPSGLGIYTSPFIPGWRNSFLLASLKWGRVVRVKLNNTYNGLTRVDSIPGVPGGVDTMPYFESRNRYRDMAVSPDGKEIFIIMDKSLSTSGPSQDNPTTLNCTGCVIKYNFLGYNDNAGASTISNAIPIAPGLNNQLTGSTPTIINSDNNNLWVPVTDSLGNIIAEIDANGNNLGNITATLYKNSGTVRTTPNGTPYLDRSLTINVQNQPPVGNPVNVRLYLTAAELAALVAAPGSGVTNINNINIFRNADADGSTLTTLPTNITPVSRTAFGNDYVLKASIDTFSTFYFANATSVPITPMFTFTGNALSNFTTTFGTPSAAQSYTISGLNLTPGVANGISITAPANYEVSLINETFTGTNGNTVTLSSNALGKIVGEPVNIYVQYNPAAAGAHAGNITHSGAGVTPATNIAVTGNASGYYYSKATGLLTNIATWGISLDGTGPAPSVFSTNSQTFEIRNRPTATITANWTVSGTSSKILVGTGTDFTIPSGNTVTGTIDVAAGAELTLINTVLPTFGTLAANSTVEYAQTAVVNILNFTSDAVTYANLKMSGTGTKTFKSNTTTVTGNIVYDGLTGGNLPLSAAAAQATTLNLGGDLTYLGAVTNPADNNCYVLNSTSNSTQTITGNNNVARLFRLVTGLAGNNMVLSNVGGTTNAYLGNANAGGLTLSNGTTLNIGGNTLTVTGPVNAGTGTLTGSPTSNLIIGGTALNQALNFTQTSESTRSLNNLTLNAAGSATLNTALELYGVLSLSSANLNLNTQHLTLKSTAAGTARVANLTGNTLSNASNVSVERYIANPQRSWHLLSAKAVTGSQTIYNSWQEGGAIVASKGTWMTSGSTLLPGFDGSSVNGSSILIHDQTIPSWTSIPVANTNSTAFSSRQGYMLFVRGDRTCTPGNTLVTPTVLKANGLLTQGNVNVTVSATGTGKTLVGNPYASPIDFESIAGTANLDQNFMVWDPALAGNYGVGGYRAVVRTGVNAYDQTPVILGGTVTNDPTIQYIHSGQAFFVHATGANANIAFTEASKATTPTVIYNPIVATSGDQQIITNLMLMNAGNATLVDGLRVYYAATNSATTNDDIIKMGNYNENISSYREGLKLIVEKRPMIASTDTIFLRMTNTGIKNYRLQIGTVDFVQTNAVAYLQDAFLNSTTPIDLISNAINNIDFSVTSDPASANQDRFRIVFALSGPLPTTFTSVKASQTAGPGGQGSNIEVEWKVSNQVNIQKYEVEKSTDGINFSKAATQTATGSSDAVYNWLDVNPVMGNNFYRIRSIGVGSDVKISQVVKVTMGKGNPSIVVYPNPVTKRIVAVQFNEMATGNYQVKLIGTTGQVVYIQTLKHNGGSATQTIALGSEFAKGVYLLEITNPDNIKTTKALVIRE